MQLAQVGNILGGEKVLGKKLANKMDLVELGNRGITKNDSIKFSKNFFRCHQSRWLIYCL